MLLMRVAAGIAAAGGDMEALARVIEEGGELPPLPATEVRAVQHRMPQMIVPRLCSWLCHCCTATALQVHT
jgi:cytochrome c oxidase assembly factor CtaG